MSDIPLSAPASRVLVAVFDGQRLPRALGVAGRGVPRPAVRHRGREIRQETLRGEGDVYETDVDAQR